MFKLKTRNCDECRECNRKGRVSVTKYSKYCDDHFKFAERNKNDGMFSFLSNWKDKIFQSRLDPEKNEIKNSKGFRPSWWYR